MIIHSGYIDDDKLTSPTVKEYDNPRGNTKLQNIPGAREYSDMLPEEERFLIVMAMKLSRKT